MQEGKNKAWTRVSSGKGDGGAEGEAGAGERRAGRNREGGVGGRPGEGASSVLSLGGQGSFQSLFTLEVKLISQ